MALGLVVGLVSFRGNVFFLSPHDLCHAAH